MKNAYWAVLVILLFVSYPPLSAETTSIGGGTILIVDDDVSTGGCVAATNGVKTISLKAANIPATCIPTKIQVLHATSGVELGISDLIFFTGNDWTQITNTGLSDNSNCSSSIYELKVSIPMDFSDISICSASQSFAGDDEIPVKYYLLNTVEGNLITDNSAPGGYELYDVNTTCFDLLFPNSCFNSTYDSSNGEGEICIDCDADVPGGTDDSDGPGDPDTGFDPNLGTGDVPKGDGRFGLKQDNSGNTTSAKNSNKVLNIFPNPTTNLFSVAFNSEKEINTFITLFDMNGQLLQNNQVFATKGQNTFEVNVSHLPNGVYLVKVFDGKNTRIERVAKTSN